MSVGTPPFMLGLELISNLPGTQAVRPPPEPQVASINLSNELGLTYGTNTSLKVMLKYRGRPIRYIKFLTYDRYEGLSWCLSLGNLTVLHVNYNVTRMGEYNYLITIYFKEYNLRVTKEVHVSNESDYTLLEYGGDKVFRLGNLTLLPMPPVMAFGTSPLESTIPVNVLTSVIPIPKAINAHTQLNATVYVDRGLRYVGIDLGNKSLERVLVKSSSYEQLSSILLNFSVIDSCNLVLKVMSSREGGAYSREFVGLMKNLTLKYFLPMCTYGGSIHLSKLVDILTMEVRTRAEYGPVNLSAQGSKYGDAVTAFLIHVRKGMCIHYASALTLMLRFLGVNSSMTVGLYYVGVKEDKAIYGLHAWTEVNPDIPGVIGYINVDPSPSGAVATTIMSGEPPRVRGTFAEGASPSSIIEPFPHVAVRVRGRLLERFPRFEVYDPLSSYLGETFFNNITSITIILAVAVFVLTMSRRFITLIRGLAIYFVVATDRTINYPKLIRKAITALYYFLNVDFREYLTFREAVDVVSSYMSSETLTTLNRLVSVYEGWRYGGRENDSELRYLMRKFVAKVLIAGAFKWSPL
ncbi:MAG: transglutaminase domain-containing protein [Desulfurococcales archaeon]|nr:transglutaminase domain-containing protein [Desulfurococcales archaeon]